MEGAAAAQHEGGGAEADEHEGGWFRHGRGRGRVERRGGGRRRSDKGNAQREVGRRRLRLSMVIGKQKQRRGKDAAERDSYRFLLKKS